MRVSHLAIDYPTTEAVIALAALFHNRPDAPIETTADQAAAAAAAAIDSLWLEQGGIYAGIARGRDGRPDQHLVLCPAEPPKKLNWADAKAWAEGLKGGDFEDWSLPSRFESALLYANLNDRFDTGNWYWTDTPYGDSNAWTQLFNNGYQNYNGKSFDAKARAVRRFNV